MRADERNGSRAQYAALFGYLGYLGCLVMATGAAGCGGARDGSPATVDTVQFKLDFGDGVTLNSVDYILTGPASFRQTGTLNVAGQPTITATFPSLPPGTGYDIKVQGAASDNLNACKGEAMFNVVASMNAVVQIALTCSGRATLAADVNTCPTIDSLSVVPAEVYVGGSVQLTATSHDPDNGPSPLAATWSATSGTLTGLSTTGATFSCSTAGTFKVSLSVSDGTANPKCADSASVTVTCTPPPSAMLMTAASAGAV
jgi:hypothetical protein